MASTRFIEVGGLVIAVNDPLFSTDENETPVAIFVATDTFKKHRNVVTVVFPHFGIERGGRELVEKNLFNVDHRAISS
jgi:hypothetical protein